MSEEGLTVDEFGSLIFNGAVSAMHMSPSEIDDSQFIKVDMSIEGQKHQKRR